MRTLSELMQNPTVHVLLDILRLSNTETYEHSYHVAVFVEEMLHETGYNDSEKEEILIGCLLHDIGKAFIPLNLMQLPQSLSEEQHNIIKVHTSVSYEIVKNVFSEIVQNICLLHHERIDGSGYMSHRIKEEIPDYVLLMQVADVFDALISPRRYKKEYTKERAIEILHKEVEANKLDRAYVDLLESKIN